MKKGKSATYALLLVVLLGCLAWWFIINPDPSQPESGDPVAPVLRSSGIKESDAARAPDTATLDTPAELPPPPAQAVAPPDRTPAYVEIEALESELLSAISVRQSRQALADLRAYLLDLPPEVASRAITDYLSTGRDADTGMPFSVGRGGQLAYASSLRTFLMDLLGQIDPAAAARQAEVVFESKTNAEEYALGLRNVAWAGEGAEVSRSYVAERARELLQYEPWVEAPTAGFAEAFDAVVWAKDLQAIPILAGHAAPDGAGQLDKPAFMALDRLVLVEPGLALEHLVDAPALLDDRPLTRAGFFARADPGDAVQTSLAEAYLSQAPAAEADYFMRLYPNLNLMLSNNLLSTNHDFEADDIRRRLADALDVVRNWQRDPRFERYSSQLKKAEARLADQVE